MQIIDESIIEDNNIKIKRAFCAIIVVAVFALLFVKNEYSQILLRNCTHGMPALIEKGHIDNLFIGSSTFRQGLSIDVLDEGLSGDNYILAYNGNEPFLEFIELQKIINGGVDIGHIYIDMYAYTVDRSPKLDDEKLLLEFNLKEKIELYNMLDGHSISKWWQMFISSNNDMLLTWPINKRLIDSKFRNGGTLIESLGLDEYGYDSIVAPDTETELDDTQVEAILNIIDICHKKDIELTFIETPKAGIIMNNRSYQNLMEKYVGILSDYDVDAVRADISNMLYSDYSDGIHLSSNGRVKYTEWLVDRIKPRIYQENT